jgi:hypothetical protein
MATPTVTKRRGFRDSVAGSEVIAGPLRKMAVHGSWQERYFRVANHYLTYFTNKVSDSPNLNCAIMMLASLGTQSS